MPLEPPLWSDRLSAAAWMKSLARVPDGLYRHGALGSAKGAAYSALLSFFPIFTITTATLVKADAPELAHRIASLMYEFSPPQIEQLLRTWFAERSTQRYSVHLLAVLLSLWAGSGVMASLVEGFQSTYEKRDSRNFVHQRGIELILVVLSLLPAVGATALIILGDRVETNILRNLGVIGAEDILRPGVRIVGRLIRYAVALSSVCFVTTMLYKFGPDAGKRRRVLPGALLATFLWLVLTQLFAWYLLKFANYHVFYGSIGAVIAFLVWMYLLALVALIGCEFNAALDRARAKA